MARSNITTPTSDVQNDSGAVLWSIIQGEQLEYPVQLEFLQDVLAGYTFEAVIVEADNDGAGTKPTAIKQNGVQSKLNVRKPVFRGLWNAEVAYDAEDLVDYGGAIRRLTSGTLRVSAILPTNDPLWVPGDLQTVYLQVASNTADTWSVQPTAAGKVYGFIELRVTEPAGVVFKRTWKPLRGMVEIQFSPTHLVPD